MDLVQDSVLDRVASGSSREKEVTMALPYQIINRRTAAIESTAVTVNTDNVVFTFPNHSFLGLWYRGSVYINLVQAIPAETTGTLPVLLQTNGVTQAVTKVGGDPLTVADIPGTGWYEFFYDKSSGLLQIMPGVN